MTSPADDEETPLVAVIARLGGDEFLIAKLARPTPDSEFDVYFDVTVKPRDPGEPESCVRGPCNLTI